MLMVIIFWIIALALFLTIEMMHRVFNYRPIVTRKIAHTSLALLAASLPLWLTFYQIFICLLPFIIIIAFSYITNIFHSIHDVKRKTYGEILFPVGMIIALLISHHNLAVYSLALLILAFADPIAEFIGMRYKKWPYMRGKKTVIGSLAFGATTLIITIIFSEMSHLPVTYAQCVIIMLVATIAEGLSVYGTDNLSVPFAVSLLTINMI